MNKKEMLIGLAAAACLALFLSPFASPFPDGLEKVAETHSFLSRDFGLWKIAPLPDYLWPGLKNEKLSTGLAGLLGVVLVFLLSVGLGKLTRMKKRGGSA